MKPARDLSSRLVAANRSLVFRADLDGLSVQEEGTADYRSTVPGVMHGCGHDAHTAIGTGIAGVLSRADRLPQEPCEFSSSLRRNSFRVAGWHSSRRGFTRG